MFTTHIDKVKTIFVYSMRNCVKVRALNLKKNVLLHYFSSKIKPIIQNSVLVYGCVNYKTLETLVLMQKKIFRLILFLKYTENVAHLFENFKILTAHELHVYQLLKYVIKSVNKIHTDTYLNDLFFCDSRSTHLTNRSLKW